VAEDNGIYMKHLKNHICRNVKIEDVLHAVTTGNKPGRYRQPCMSWIVFEVSKKDTSCHGFFLHYFENMQCMLTNSCIFIIADVERDTLGCVYTERQRPEYVVQGGGHYSLRDRIEAHGNRSAERWLEAHSKSTKGIVRV
jgi:hypothetical protein